MKILFVCTGNTCRSPMAEALLKNKMPQVEVQSAGIFAGTNERANEKTIHVLKEQNIDFDHKTQPVTERLLSWADLVLTMTAKHKQALILDFPNEQDKFFTLKEYVSDADREIWDKLKKAHVDFMEKRQRIEQENKDLSATELHQKIRDELGEEISNIRSLEAALINLDVSDPFGGDIDVYRKTLEELNENIDLLMKKIQ